MKKWKKGLTILAAFFVVFSLGTTAIADHDDDDDEEYEYYHKDHGEKKGESYKYEEEDDDDEEWEGNQQQQIQVTQQADYWNIWSREPVNNPENTLPVDSPSNVLVIAGNKKTNMYFIPRDGQLLVGGETLANVIDADSTFYPTSKICVLKKGEKELIVKAGSNAAYENRMKTPMPVPAAAYENTVYLPISVAANALGYRVTWDAAKKAIILQAI